MAGRSLATLCPPSANARATGGACARAPAARTSVAPPRWRTAHQHWASAAAGNEERTAATPCELCAHPSAWLRRTSTSHRARPGPPPPAASQNQGAFSGVAILNAPPPLPPWRASPVQPPGLSPRAASAPGIAAGRGCRHGPCKARGADWPTSLRPCLGLSIIARWPPRCWAMLGEQKALPTQTPRARRRWRQLRWEEAAPGNHRVLCPTSGHALGSGWARRERRRGPPHHGAPIGPDAPSASHSRTPHVLLTVRRAEAVRRARWAGRPRRRRRQGPSRRQARWDRPHTDRTRECQPPPLRPLFPPHAAAAAAAAARAGTGVLPTPARCVLPGVCRMPRRRRFPAIRSCARRSWCVTTQGHDCESRQLACVQLAACPAARPAQHARSRSHHVRLALQIKAGLEGLLRDAERAAGESGGARSAAAVMELLGPHLRMPVAKVARETNRQALRSKHTKGKDSATVRAAVPAARARGGACGSRRGGRVQRQPALGASPTTNTRTDLPPLCRTTDTCRT